MFCGFSDETIEYFLAIGFNNNPEFFHENRAWYERAVRGPAIALAEALESAIEALDPNLERRPSKVVSRPNRDVRFSSDKSPYKDYVFVTFRAPGEGRWTEPGVFFDMGASGARYGMGYYSDVPGKMNAVRRALRERPDEFSERLAPLFGEFAVRGNAFKKLHRPPEGMPPELAAWYPLKGFWLEKPAPFALAMSPGLADEIKAGIERFGPLYRFIQSLPEEKNGAPERE